MNVTLDGISQIEGPRNLNALRGKLTLPPNFPEERFAVKWAKQGQGVASARESENITGTNLKVVGWEVWRDAHKKLCVRNLESGGAFVLMVRPKTVQMNVNRICANLSRDRLKNEVRGHTVAGGAREDSGVLTEPTLARVEGITAENDNSAVEDRLPSNPLVTTEARVSSRAKLKLKSK